MWAKFVILLSGLSLARADHWGYLEEQANGVIKGEEDWGGQCTQGRRQSPVDLTEEASIIGQYPSLMFANYSEPLVLGKVRNTGHSLQIDAGDDQEYIMTGGGLPGTYIMDQMHFHWASEHTVNAERYGLELHIVSHERRFKKFEDALEVKNGVAVLGILFHVSEVHNKVLKNILDSAESIKDESGKSSLIKTPFSPAEFLPDDLGSFFRYEGSLTTPGCDEAVIWTVITKSIPFAFSQIERFKDVKDDKGESLTHNYRTLQRLNSRPLVYVKDNKFSESSACIKSLSLFAAVFVIFARFVF